MDTSTIKSYLVSLGFEADDNMYRKFSAALAKASREVEKHTGIMSNSYVKAGGVIVGAVGTVVTSTTMLLNSLAKADLGYEKYAMRMYMARDAAKQFKIVTDTMGESLEDIAWIPELNEKYKLLMEDAKKMELPKEYQEEMKMIRGIGFEFTRLKVESIYSLQWIGHNLIKNLMQPLMGTKGSFKDLNDYIIEKMPEWSDKIATTFGNMLAIVKDNITGLKDLTGGLKKVWDGLSPESKKAVVIGGGIGLLAKAVASKSPVARAAAVGIGAMGLTSEWEQSLAGKKTTIPTGTLQGITVGISLLDSLFQIGKAVGYSGEAILSPDLYTPKGYMEAIKAPWKGATKYKTFMDKMDEVNPLWMLSGEKREQSSEKIEGQIKNINEIIKNTFGDKADIMARIAVAESGDARSGIVNMGAINYNKDEYGNIKSTDYGMFQINDKAWENELKKAGIIKKDMSELLDEPLKSVEGAKYILEHQGLSAWEASRIRDNETGWGQTGQTINIENVNLNNYKANEAGRAGNDFVTTVRACVAKGTCAN